MVKKSKGFNWGPAATGCSRWTGVRLSTLLKACGVQSHQQVRKSTDRKCSVSALRWSMQQLYAWRDGAAAGLLC